MAPYFPIHHLGFTPKEQVRSDSADLDRHDPIPLGRDDAGALKRMGIVLTVVALFLFLVAMVGR